MLAQITNRKLSAISAATILLFVYTTVHQYLAECQTKHGSYPQIERSRPKICQNKTTRKSIFYIKVQKTGSTSLKSSLLNFGMKMNLQICMDSLDLHHMNFPYPIDPVRLTKPYFSRCELIADELVYQKSTVDRLMRKNPLVLASVRHPVTHFISLFKFAKIQHAVQLLTLEGTDLWESIKIFLKHPQLVQNIYATYKPSEVNVQIMHLLRSNLQMFSLGLDSNASVNDIQERAGNIELFFISEHFEESMVLLTSQICCQFKDLIFIKQNVQERLPEEEDGVPKEIEQLILDFNKGDKLLYDIAVKRFHDQRSQYFGFKQDLKSYKTTLKRYTSECRLQPPLRKDSNNNVCLAKIESDFYNVVREKQKSKLLRSLQTLYDKTSASPQ